MDSSIPPPPSHSAQRKLRPWYLVPTMVVAWSYGMNGLLTGCATASFLREATVPDVASAIERARGSTDPGEIFNLSRAVTLQTLHELGRITFPLNVAQALLAALLVFASGLAMSGRKGARMLTLQALLANAVLAFVAYALTENVRATYIETMVRAAQSLPPEMPAHQAFAFPELLWVGFRIKLVVFELGSLALGMLALTRGRTRLYFDAMAKATEGAEEP